MVALATAGSACLYYSMLTVRLNTHLQAFHLALDFTADQGKTTLLLGESGAGKSTVLRLLAGLLHPQQGQIIYDGRVYFDSERHINIPPQERPFGYVFQDYALFPHLNVWENISFGLHAQHLSRTLIRQRVGEVLELVQLSGYERRKPAQLSGGQQQRVAIARSLALKPQLLLLDEPLSALDVQTRRSVRQELRQILHEVGITTIMVTHQYLEALLFGDQILVLDRGKILQAGAQADLVQYPRSSYVAELIGMNFFQGTILDCTSDQICTIQLHQQAGKLEISATLEGLSEQPEITIIGKDAYIVVHPRNITLHQDHPEGSARNLIEGKIIQLLYLGNTDQTQNESGHVRVSIIQTNALSGTGGSGTLPITAEITAASAARMHLTEGSHIFASFKAVEARAYL